MSVTVNTDNLRLDDPALLAPLRWDGEALHLLDQRLLPGEERWYAYRDAEAVASAIRDMVVRGAPAIGITAAYGVALGVMAGQPVAALIELLRRTRPTAVNLFWALERMGRVAQAESVRASADPAHLAARLVAEAVAIHREDVESCLAIGAHGAALLPDGVVLTHCNAGALATGGYGTALGVIRGAVAAGRKLRVLADETRPYLQGARLTCWELQRSGIDVTLITDNMAGHLMARGEVQSVVVGADRIAKNGDTANKIGTYTVAVLAREHGVPFYVAAPLSTIDLSTASGAAIPIEERSAEEVVVLAGTRLAPRGVPARHPAFDVTPARLITAIITERGVARPDYQVALPSLFAAPDR